MNNPLDDYERERGDNPGAGGDELSDARDMTPDEREAIEAFFAEPFPSKPYALVPSGGDNATDFTDYIIHKDINTEHQCVFVFDSIVDAFAVAEEYKEATGREAEPVECDIYSLEEDRFWVKFYRANGSVAMISLPLYKQHIGGTASPYED